MDVRVFGTVGARRSSHAATQKRRGAGEAGDAEAEEGNLAHTQASAAEGEGGDIRGRQSAAILVVPREGEPWERVVELRVEDDPEPLVELRRLVALKAAYVRAAEGDDLHGRGDHAGAEAKYIEAWEMAPECEELSFWAALSLIRLGDVDRGLPLLRRTVAAHAGWLQLLGMLDEDEAPGAPEARRLLGI